MPAVQIIPAIAPQVTRKRVAAYCRVSSDSDDQLNSFAVQVEHYTHTIQENNDDDRGSVPMRQIAALNDEILQLKQILQQADAKQVSNRSDALTQEFIQLVSSTDFNATGYSDTLVIRTIEEITVLSHDKIRIRFMGGYAVEEYIVKI